MATTLHHSKLKLISAILLFATVTIVSDLSLGEPTAKSMLSGNAVFVANNGQAPDDILYTTWGGRASIAIRANGLTLLTGVKSGDHENPQHFSLEWIDATSSEMEGKIQLPEYHNYFLGTDRSTWATRVPLYERLSQTSLVAGLDVEYSHSDDQLICELRIDPQAMHAPLRIRLTGTDSTRIDRSGDVRVFTPSGVVEFSASGSARGPGVATDSRSSLWRVERNGRSELLVLDLQPPAGAQTAGRIFRFRIILSLSGTSDDKISAVESDTAGNFYVVGMTRSADFQAGMPSGSYQSVHGGDWDVFVAKFDSTLTLQWWTFLGGSAEDKGRALTVSPATGNIYVVGGTRSVNFPVTGNAFDNTWDGAGDNAFIAYLIPDGTSLQYSSYFGAGVSWGDGIGVESDFNTSAYAVTSDATGNCYVAGGTNSALPFGIPGSAYDPAYYGGVNDPGPGLSYYPDAWVAKFNPVGANLLAGTYIGGAGAEIVSGIAVDDSSNVYICGYTTDPEFFDGDTTGYVFTAGLYDALKTTSFVTSFTPDLSALRYSYGRGGTNAFSGATDMVLDSQNRAYVCGITQNQVGGVGGFPTTPGAYDSVQSAFYDESFVYRVNALGTDVDWVTLVGWDRHDRINGIALDLLGLPYVTGTTESDPFPVTPPGQRFVPYSTPNKMLFLIRLDSLGTRLDFADLMGFPYPSLQSFGSPVAIAGTRTVVGGHFTSPLLTGGTDIQTQLWGLQMEDLYQPMAFDSAYTHQPLLEPLPPGSTQVRILTIVVENSGALSPLSATRFDIDLAGTTNLADLSNARLYYTGNSGSYNTSVTFGSQVASPPATFSFSGSQTFAPGVNYFHLAIDVAAGAVVGNFVDASCTAVEIDASDRLPNPVSAPGALRIGPAGSGLSGTAFVGDGGDYATVSDALAALVANGLSGNVTFNVVQRNRRFGQVNFSSPGGIRPQPRSSHSAAQGDTITIQGIVINGVKPEFVYGAFDPLLNFVFRIDYPDPSVTVLIKDLKITAIGTDYSTAIEIADGTNNVRIENCDITSEPTFGNSLNQTVIRSWPMVGSVNSNIQIVGNTILGGTSGIDLRDGFGLEITDNIITGQSANGILAVRQAACQILRNTITLPAQTVAPKGMWLSECYGNTIVSANTIHVESGVGLVVQSCSGGTDSILISTNFIDVDVSPSGTGVSISFSTGPIAFHLNNVNIWGANCDSAAAYVSIVSPNVNRVGNVLKNDCGGFVDFIMNTLATTPTPSGQFTSSDYNDLYTTGPVLGVWNGTDAADLAALRALNGQESNTLSVDPLFVSNTDLHTTSPALVGAGIWIPGITTDHDGNAIDSANPSIGGGQSTPVGIDDPDQTVLPDRFTLGPNFPNPFNAQTLISFALARPDHIKLDVFNVLGQKVITLMDGDLPAGRHEVVWEGLNSQGESVASGVYFYRLEIADEKRTRKMVLLK